MTGLALRASVPKWNVESELGYKPITTFWEDFSIADKFGNEAVNDTFKRAFTEWKGNYAYLTEMVNFTDQTATLDVSDLDCGVYLITVEYENGTIYTGQIEFTE